MREYKWNVKTWRKTRGLKGYIISAKNRLKIFSIHSFYYWQNLRSNFFSSIQIGGFWGMPIFCQNDNVYLMCVLHFYFIIQNLHYKHKTKTKKTHHLWYRLLSDTKNDIILQFSHLFINNCVLYFFLFF